MVKANSEYIEDMLRYKESIGYSRSSYEYDLARFCKFMESKQLLVDDLKEEIVLSWCTRWESESFSGARRRIQTVRELLKYLSAIGIGCYVIPFGFIPRQETPTPYIFTDEELLSIFKECDELTPHPCSPHKHPFLSTYMGHTHFSDTAYYIHLLPENLIRSAAIDWEHFSDLIPEVNEDE